MRVRFDRQTVVVTGAAQGIGRSIAHSFARLGAIVWACDRDAEVLAQTAHESPEPLRTRVLDVTDHEAVAAFVAEAEGHDRSSGGAGRVAVLVQSAGGVAGQVGRPLEEVAPEEWRVVFAVNVDAAFSFAQAVAPAMKRAKAGRIINISSGAGLGVSLTGIQAYASAKAAQIGLTRQLAHELGPWGITVNSVAPGFVRSNPTSERQWQSYGEEGQRALLERVALRRLGTPQDIADAVLFFASEHASWVTGQTLSVDGGK